MTDARHILTVAALAVTSLSPTNVFAHSQDEVLRDVHAALRITGANVQWIRNRAGGFTPTLVYDVTNIRGWSVPVPVTVIGGTAANWAGSREHWIERLGSDPTIPAMPRGFARRGRQYAYGGSAIAWPAQFIAPRGSIRFSEPMGIGGFPSGRYALHVEYRTTHKRQLIQTQVVYFDIP